MSARHRREPRKGSRLAARVPHLPRANSGDFPISWKRALPTSKLFWARVGLLLIFVRIHLDAWVE